MRRRQTRIKKEAAEFSSKSLSPSTSSFYISPIQQQDQHQQQVFSSENTIYQLPFDDNNIYNNRKFSPLYRTDSFRQAILSGHKRTNQTTEHISTKRDSLIRRSLHDKDDVEFPTYCTLEFNNQPQTRTYRNSNKISNDVYQVVIPSSPTILTHVV